MPDLIDSLQNAKAQLLDYSKAYALSAMNASMDRFVIIPKFAARKRDGEIDMLNSSDIEGGEHYPISQFGMTLVEDSGIATSSQNIVLPNALNYEHVEWNGDVISIHHSNGITTTNFSEISSLWTFESLEEKEILNRFNSLTNSVEAPPQEIEKYLASSIEDDFFGHLQLNKELDRYEVTRDNIEFSSPIRHWLN